MIFLNREPWMSFASSMISGEGLGRLSKWEVRVCCLRSKPSCGCYCCTQRAFKFKIVGHGGRKAEIVGPNKRILV